MIDRIPKDLPITLIASDIDKSILNSIVQRHPYLQSYIQQINKGSLKLELLRMDATNMYPLKENSTDGVSASAVVHEIFSYVPTKNSLDQFFHELIRILKKEGIFIYRDAKWDDNPRQDCLLILKNQLAKFFTVLFLPCLLDRTFTVHKDYNNQCIKPNLYNESYIRINFFKKGFSNTKKVKLNVFLNTPLSSIDFSKNISIEAPRGLISEIQRHYILFIKNVFITDLIDKNFFDRKIIAVESLDAQEKALMKYFLNKNNVNSLLIDTSLNIFQNILHEKKLFFDFIENGISIKINDRDKAQFVCNKLYSSGISRDLIFIQSDKLWADAKIAVLLFKESNKDFFNIIQESKELIPMQVLAWMKREGEEFYFYKTTDELIAYVGRFTRHYLKGTDKDGYMLCPINAQSIKTVSRDLYKSIVDTHMAVMDIDGNTQNIIFDKNIIHFKLMTQEDAKKIYKDILKENKYTFHCLKEWLENEF